eukprot:m.351105 g.351105  ORF g.351105 m.351105 type:complete len:60 (-) comp55907_c0_seq7:2028-2207(-)
MSVDYRPDSCAEEMASSLKPVLKTVSVVPRVGPVGLGSDAQGRNVGTLAHAISLQLAEW